MDEINLEQMRVLRWMYWQMGQHSTLKDRDLFNYYMNGNTTILREWNIQFPWVPWER